MVIFTDRIVLLYADCVSMNVSRIEDLQTQRAETGKYVLENRFNKN